MYIKNDKGIIINKNDEGLQNYKNQKEQIKKQKVLNNKINDLENRINILEKQLKQILEKNEQKLTNS